MKNTIRGVIVILSIFIFIGLTLTYSFTVQTTNQNKEMVTTTSIEEPKDYSYLLTNYGLNIENYIKDMTLEQQLSTVIEIQSIAHTNAEIARSLEVCEETANIIDKNKEIWYNANIEKQKILIAIDEYNYNLELLARVIWYEAGSNWLTDEHQQLVGLVVMNRVALNASSIEEVMAQKGQYSCCKLVLYGETPDGITQRCYDNAALVLQGKVTCPENVIFQAEFKQGEVYKKFYNSYSGTTTYFCFAN